MNYQKPAMMLVCLLGLFLHPSFSIPSEAKAISQKQPTRRAYDIEWQPTGNLLAVADHNEIWIYDVGEDIEEVDHIQRYFLASLSWSPDGTLLAILADVEGDSPFDRGWTLEILDIATLEIILTIDQASFPSDFSTVSWSPNGDLLAVGVGEEIQIRDAMSGAIIEIFSNRDGSPSLDWNPDGVRLAAPSGRAIIIWDVYANTQLNLIEDEEIFELLAWSPDGEFIASTSGDRTSVRIWSVLDKEEIALLEAHEPITDLKWETGGLASGSIGGTIIVWDIENQQPAQSIESSIGSLLYTFAWSPDGKNIAYWDDYEGLKITPIEKFLDGRLLVSAGDDGTIRLWGIPE